MEKYFSVGQAAKITNTTTEALRHYDRIGLVKPTAKDELTGYRQYTYDDIVRLKTIYALKRMDLSLQEIKEALEYKNIEEIINFLSNAEVKIDEKIADLKYCKSKIEVAKEDYLNKQKGLRNEEYAYTKHFSKRVIMLSETLDKPTLENLWGYLDNFYNQIPSQLREEYTFEDLAGIYTKAECSKLFAVCIDYKESQELITLPEGNYLCANSTEENRKEVVAQLIKTAQDKYNVLPEFTLQIIVVTGILHWNYQVQVFLG